MVQKIVRNLRKIHLEQKGMTGLETAIILIAFVTVASVLAYSVLSAGIFSAERGKETVYSGLAQASATLKVAGTVVGYSSGHTRLEQMRIKLSLTDPNEQVDSGGIKVSFIDDTMTEHLTSGNITLTKLSGSTERGATDIIEADEVWELVVTMPATSNVAGNDWAIIQVTPPSGATLAIKKTMPSYLATFMNLR